MEKEFVKKVLSKKDQNPDKTFREIFKELGFSDDEFDKVYNRFNYYRKKYDLDQKDYTGSNMKVKEKNKSEDDQSNNQSDPDPERNEIKDNNLLEKSLTDIKKKAGKTNKNKSKPDQKKQSKNKPDDPDPERKLKIMDLVKENKNYLYILVGLIGAGLAIRQIRIYIKNKNENEKMTDPDIRKAEKTTDDFYNRFGIEKAEY